MRKFRRLRLFKFSVLRESETPVCPHLLRNPRRNQDRPQIWRHTLYLIAVQLASLNLFTGRFFGWFESIKDVFWHESLLCMT